MKTRDELLAMAESEVEVAMATLQASSTYVALANTHANLAQACVMLAKELREGERVEALRLERPPIRNVQALVGKSIENIRVTFDGDVVGDIRGTDTYIVLGKEAK